MTDRTISELPPVIVDRLKAVIRRVRRIQWLKGGFATLAVLVIAVLMAMGLDAAFALDSRWMRVGLTVAVMVSFVAALWHFLLRPLSRKISLSTVARWIETHHPEMQERISTSVELLAASRQSQGSRELLDEVVRDAVVDAGKVNPQTELSTGMARRPMIAGLAAVVALALCVLLLDNGWRLLQRVLRPFADIGNVYADNIRLITKDLLIPEGSPLEIELAVQSSDDRVQLHMVKPDGTEVVETLSADAGVKVEKGEQGYALRIREATEGFRYYVTAGRAKSDSHSATVIPLPAVAGMRATFDYPDYMGMPTETRDLPDGAILAPAGTKVTVQAVLKHAVKSAAVHLNNNPDGDLPVGECRTLTAGDAPGAEWTFTLPANLETTWRWELAEEHGYKAKRVDYPIRSTPDLPPAIVLVQPVESEMELRPFEELPVSYIATEDYGLSALRIKVRPAGKDEIAIDLPLPQRMEPADDGDSSRKVPQWPGVGSLALAKLPLEGVNELRFNLEVADTMPDADRGPQTARSREVLIRLRRDAKSLMEQTFAKQAKQLQKDLEEAKKLVADAKWRMDPKKDQLAQQEQIQPNVLKELEESAQAANKAEEKLQEIAAQMENTAYSRQAEDIRAIAEDLVKPAAKTAEDIPLTDSREKRSEMAAAAQKQLETALRALEEKQQQMYQEQQEAEKVARLNDVAQQQQRLAEQAAERSQQLAADAAKQAQDLAEKAEELAKDQAAAAQQIAQAQTPEEMRKAAESQQQVEKEANALREAAEKFREQNRGELADNAAQEQAVKEALQDVNEGRMDAQQAASDAQLAANLNSQQPQAPPQLNDGQKQQNQQAAQQAQQLAAKAEDLAKKQEALAERAADATTPEKQAALDQAQTEAEQEARQFAEQVQQFHNQNGEAISRDAEVRNDATQALQDASEARENAREAREEAQAARQESQQQEQQNQQAKSQGMEPPANQPNAGADEAQASAGENKEAAQDLQQAAKELNSLAQNLTEAAAQQPDAAPRPQGQDEAQAASAQAQSAQQEFAEAAESLGNLAEQLEQEAAARQADATQTPQDASQQAQAQNSPAAQNQPQNPAAAAEQAAQQARQAQQEWQNQQNQVAQQAATLQQQAQQQNQEARQQELGKAAGTATQLAQKAEALAKAQQELGAQIAAADSPQAQQSLAQQQNALAAQTEALQTEAQVFQQQHAPQIDQSSTSQEAAHAAQQSLESARTEAAEAGKELAAAAAQPAEGEPAQGQPAEGQPAEGTPAGAQPAAGASEGQPGNAPPSGESGNAPPAAGQGQPSEGSPAPAGEAPPAAGEAQGQPASPQASAGESAGTAASALSTAAKALESLSQSLEQQAGTVADFAKSMQQGAQQSQQAAQAGQQSQQQGMQSAAQNAQQAAQNLSNAAQAAMKTMSIPSSATGAQMPKPGQGQSGQNPPSQGQAQAQNQQPAQGEGTNSQNAMQQNGADGKVPDDLAKLGLTVDDWMKIRSTMSGANAADGDKVPAEYRDLVKAYFGALAEPAKK